MIVKYEDLVSEPKKEISKICKFLKVPFENKMLNVTGKKSSIKKENKKGIDKTRAFLWKKKIRGWEYKILTATLKKDIKEFKYGI